MKQTWKQLIIVQTGGAICLPVFIIGHALAKSYGIYSAILAIVLGNFLLLIMAFFAAASSSLSQKSTAEIAVDVFGERGKKMFSAALVFSMVGWFAIQMNIMSRSFEPFIGTGFALVLNLLIGTLITLFAIKGIQTLTRIATLSLPCLLLTIGYAVFSVSDKAPLIAIQENLSFQGISLVVACSIAAVIDLPTFFRLAKSQKDGILAAILLFGVVLPIIQSVGLYLFIQGEGENFVQLLSSLSSPFLWKVWVFAFLLLAGWTTNNANLYSASISLKTFSEKLSETQRIVLIGLVGTILSCFNLFDHLILTLDLIGIVLASMGALIVLHLALKEPEKAHEKKNIIAIMAWALGILGGLAAYFGYGLINIAVLDAFIIALLTKLVLKGITSGKFINAKS